MAAQIRARASASLNIPNRFRAASGGASDETAARLIW